MDHHASALEFQQWVEQKVRSAESSRHKQELAVPLRLQQLARIDLAALAPLDLRMLGTLSYPGYRLLKILFQSQPGTYVPANLYVPHGAGPFPAVLNSHGHWPAGKAGEIIQRTAQALVHAGYVVLCIDAWGTGERGSGHKHEYHGARLAAKLLDAGETLLGLQLLDNYQAVSLLCALDYVDSGRIAAMGASGGGNQTMWISALDERIKAAVLAVSVGTFSGYILEHNCMCELLPQGLKYLEAADVLGSIAPRAVKILSASSEQIPAFKVERMLEAFQGALPYFIRSGAAQNISYQVFDSGHDFNLEMQQSALDFLNQQLGVSPMQPSAKFSAIELERLSVIDQAQHQELVTTTDSFLAARNRAILGRFEGGQVIVKQAYLRQLGELLAVDEQLRIASQDALHIDEPATLIFLRTSDNLTIPARYQLSAGGQTVNLILQSEVQEDAAAQPDTLHVDLLGFGARALQEIDRRDESMPKFHTLMRTFLWLGENLMTRWVSEIRTLVACVKETLPDRQIQLTAAGDLALAALYYGVRYGDISKLHLKGLATDTQPLSRGHEGSAISMGQHIAGIAECGPVPLLAAMLEVPAIYTALAGTCGHPLNQTEINAFYQQVEAYDKKIER